MKRAWLIISILFLGTAAFQKALFYEKAKPEQINDAIKKSLHLLEYSSHDFLTNSDGCHSCHGQAIGSIAFSMANEKGFSVKKFEWQEALDSMMTHTHRNRAIFAECTDPVALAIGRGYDLWAMSVNKIEANKGIHLIIHDFMNRQSSNGSWVSPNNRPPIEGSVFTATALAAYGIKVYAPVAWQDKATLCISKARTWLEKQEPITNEERVFQLLGMLWTKGNPEIIRQQARKLITAQRPDGGWAQLSTLQSDAYATGQSLYALNESRQLSVDDPVYEKAVSFLINSQKSDGSWIVKTRSYAFVDFVDSGFPHGDNQYISTAGTGWATMALSLTVK